MKSKPTRAELIRLLEISAYHAYSNTIVGDPAPMVKRQNARMKTYGVGDLVMETTTLAFRPSETKKIGRVISIDGNDVTIRSLIDGKEIKWSNASFIRIADAMSFLADD